MKYLVPFDFSEVSKNAVRNALNLAEITGGNLFLLHVVNEKEMLKAKELLMNEYIAKVRLSTEIPLSYQLVVGDVFNDIGKIATYHGADYVVMGTHGVDMLQKIFGSNAIKMIRNASVPFIVFQEEASLKKVKRILIPISIETRSMQVLRFAARLSIIYKAQLCLIGRTHTDEFLKHKENSNLILAENYLQERKVDYKIELVDVNRAMFEEYVLDYAVQNNIDLIATTYFSDAVLPIFEKFVQNLIVNKYHIPILCVNAESLTRMDSILSVMTN